MVTSDFKHQRVSDPTIVTDKQISQVKKFVKGYFEKAVHKHRAYEKKRAEKRARMKAGMQSNGGSPGAQSPTTATAMEDDSDAVMTAVESMQQYDLDFPQTPPQPPSAITPNDPRLQEHNAPQ